MFTSTPHGLLPAGTITPYGVITGRTATSYQIGSKFVPFAKIHGSYRTEQPLVIFG
jgi:hypothetical protein